MNKVILKTFLNKFNKIEKDIMFVDKKINIKNEMFIFGIINDFSKNNNSITR
jgi:hypothetical protein